MEATTIATIAAKAVTDYKSSLENCTKEQLIAKLNALENAKPGQDGYKLRIGEKGGISWYGLGRFPVTQYAETWLSIAIYMGKLVAYVVEKQGQYSVKNHERFDALLAQAKAMYKL